MRMLVIGDSLSDPSVGGGRYLSEALSNCPVRNVRNLARGGWMVNQMRRRFEREVKAGLGPATHAVVFGGVNDLYSDETAGRTPEKIIADLQAIYALAASLGARVIALTVAPWGGFAHYNPRRAEATRRVNAWIQEQAASGRIAAVIDANTLLACGDPQRLCPEYEPPFRDGLHFGAKGQAVLGRALAAALTDCR
jgi:lysophospholipase L1-like esterase